MNRFIVVIVVSVLLISSCFVNLVFASVGVSSTSNFERLYIIRHESGRFFHKLYVSVTPSLYYYFQSKSHTIRAMRDYASFVTPEAVEPLAKELRKIFINDEQFVNVVLSIVHQIPYSRSGPKYPIETLVEHSGDCGALSMLAASIIKAGGIDVVLLHYETGKLVHMAIGVQLPRDPTKYRPRFTPKFYEYQGKRYWVAECTGSDWRVGEEPPSLNGSKVTVIPINAYCSSPAQISVSLNTPLKQSIITVNIYRSNFNISSKACISDSLCHIKIFGKVIPSIEKCKVTLYIINRDFSINRYVETYTDEHGWYQLQVNLTMPGIYHIIASWSGLMGYSGADSTTLTLLLGPKSIIQFEGPWFNYTMGRYGLSGLEVRKAMGLKSFFDIDFPTNETSVTFSLLILKGDIMQDALEFENETMPYALEPLRLPKDFDMKVRRFLTLVVNKSGEGLNISFIGLSQRDLQVLSTQGNETSLMPILNITDFIENGVWYKVTVESESNMTIIRLCSSSDVIWLSSVNDRAFYVLLADIKDSLAALRGLWAKTSIRPESIYVESPSPKLSWHLLILTLALIALMIIASTFTMKLLELTKNQILISQRFALALFARRL